MEIYLYTIGVSLVSFFGISILFKRYGLVDKPDGIRKIHKGEIPLGGGLGLFISASLIMYAIFPQHSLGAHGYYNSLASIWFISLIILFLGLIDDLKPLSSSLRLIIQILASWLVILVTDMYVRDLGDLLGFGNLYIGQLGIPLTIFMVVGVCNAFNMLDGMDGLVGIVLLVTSTTISIVAFNKGLPGILFLGTVILFVFLFFNLGFFTRKWKIFLGDSGSMWIGFITAWLLIALTQPGEKNLFDPVTALWLILLPLIDALSTFINRVWNKRSMFLGDRTHFHHALLDSGLKKWKVLLVFLSVSLISCGLAFYFVITDTDEPTQFYGFLTVWFFYFLLIKAPEKNIT